MRTAMAVLLLISCTFLFAQPTTQKGPPSDAKLDLFLLIGQSNMAGRGKVEQQDQTPHPRVWVLNKEEQWAPAVDPLHWDRPERVGVGPGLTFGKLVAERRPDAQIGLIPAAMGSSSIDQWKKGDELYDTAMKRAKIAMQRGTIRAILWHQGETDSDPAKLAEHPAKLKQLIANLRSDLNNPDLPFIAGQVGEFHAARKPDVPKMNQILLDLPSRVPHTACALSAGLSQMGDDTHFDAQGARELGVRYAQLYFDLTK